MLLGSRKAFAAIAAASVLVGGAGAGAAVAGRGHGEGLLLKAAAQYIGVGKADFVKDARAGKTLAQIATAHGKTVDGLKAAMLAAVKAKLDTAVVAGKATSVQEQTKLERASKLIDRIVNAKLGKVTRRAGKSRLLNAAARYIGVTPKALAADLKAGKSLAQVATDSREDGRGAEGGPPQAVQGPSGQGRRGEAHHCRPSPGQARQGLSSAGQADQPYEVATSAADAGLPGVGGLGWLHFVAARARVLSRRALSF